MGKDGKDLIVRVPPGTVVKDRATGRIIGDLVNHKEQLVVAQGGRGGRVMPVLPIPKESSPLCRSWEQGEEESSNWS